MGEETAPKPVAIGPRPDPGGCLAASHLCRVHGYVDIWMSTYVADNVHHDMHRA